MEAVSGLSINDLNKYLPAIQKVEDLYMSADKMKDGVFLGLGSEGLKKIPDNSIDLIIVDPPGDPTIIKISPSESSTIVGVIELNILL